MTTSTVCLGSKTGYMNTQKPGALSLLPCAYSCSKIDVSLYNMYLPNSQKLIDAGLALIDLANGT